MAGGPGGWQLVNNALFVLRDSKIVVHTWELEPEDREFEGNLNALLDYLVNLRLACVRQDSPSQKYNTAQQD